MTLDTPLPRLTEARTELLRTITVHDAQGVAREMQIPHERPLTMFIDQRELVTLMTLGVNPELLVLGWLLNQQLMGDATEIDSITVDWSVNAAAVKTRAGLPELQRRSGHAVITTGCGQGTAFAELLQQGQADVAGLRVAASPTRTSRSEVLALLEAVRVAPSIHRVAGSVHGCALFAGTQSQFTVEDVGRHNAIDTLMGWMSMNGIDPAGALLYTTGRLTSEMVMKAALMGLPVVISRNGVTALGLQMAEDLGMTLIGRAVNRHYLCYCGRDRLAAE